MKRRNILNFRIVFLLLAVIQFSLIAQSTDGSARMAGWLFYPQNGLSDMEYGAIALPEVSLSLNEFWDTQGTFKLNYRHQALGSEETGIEIYRLWLRAGGENYEIRAGWQKLNFGPALLLRPLMWFEQQDARDPLQLASGVPALRIRYFWQNNSNAWLWIMPSQKDTRGWEQFASEKNTLEFGGRLQVPLWNGELALTLHNRKVPVPALGNRTETRVGLDGRWDYEIGFWFEQSIDILHAAGELPETSHKFTLGADYTFGIGNGLHARGEVMWWKQGESMPSNGSLIRLNALMLDYAPGLYDRLALILFYESSADYWLRYFSWSQTYDSWVVYLNVFWNSDSFAFIPGDRQTVISGRGLQLMTELVF